jgi:Fe2+ transport system protein FeoA
VARKPTPPDKQLREWRVSIMRDKVHYLGRVVASDGEGAIDRAMEEFGIEPARRFRVIAERRCTTPVVRKANRAARHTG